MGTRLENNQRAFIQYGVSSTLAERATTAGLTLTKVRSLSQEDLTRTFGLKRNEAQALKEAVERSPIDDDTLTLLLQRSNFLCNVCKGDKGLAFIVHHIVPYSETQDNSYANLVVLCPNDHDLAHRGGLTMRITEAQLRKVKEKWEDAVERADAARAARLVQLDEGGIDYVNIRRIEELCLQAFGEIPRTTTKASLARAGILNAAGHFQQKFVWENLSGGNYLFDYPNAGETHHYRQLLAKLLEHIEFADLGAAIESGKRSVAQLQGQHAFFIGGVYSKQPAFPVLPGAPPTILHYTKRKIRVEWLLDPNYFMASSAIFRQGRKNHYMVYGLIRTVDARPSETTLVTASPLLVAQPSSYTSRLYGIRSEAFDGS